MKNMKSLRKIIKMSLMKEIFLVLNLLEEMMSLHCFMKRLKFYSQLLLKEKFNTRKDLRISDFLNLRLLILNLNSELLNHKLHKLEI
jgi:hypothetical protein